MTKGITKIRWCLAKNAHLVTKNEDGNLFIASMNHGSPSIGAEEIVLHLYYEEEIEFSDDPPNPNEYVSIYTWRDGEFDKRLRYMVYPLLSVECFDAYIDESQFDNKEEIM